MAVASDNHFRYRCLRPPIPTRQASQRFADQQMVTVGFDIDLNSSIISNSTPLPKGLPPLTLFFSSYRIVHIRDNVSVVRPARRLPSDGVGFVVGLFRPSIPRCDSSRLCSRSPTALLVLQALEIR